MPIDDRLATPTVMLLLTLDLQLRVATRSHILSLDIFDFCHPIDGDEAKKDGGFAEAIGLKWNTRRSPRWFSLPLSWQVPYLGYRTHSKILTLVGLCTLKDSCGQKLAQLEV
ncbi:hypothetical protein GUJ93_ZPchr0002g24219 [Zizania palustris]|uniref:Uncharacterized protein n=1 Tax=Zizania palustris TaxID=103762 RepID=A0A8J5VWB8_ZIZPA|nr:hypothetical protein GUJ93_ZPchr0002g24219 [Zizania palustris]